MGVAWLGFLGPTQAVSSPVQPCDLGAGLGLLRPLQVGEGIGREERLDRRRQDPVWLALGAVSGWCAPVCAPTHVHVCAHPAVYVPRVGSLPASVGYTACRARPSQA